MNILCGDSLEILRSYPDNHFDLCLTDPPYGLGTTVSKGAHGYGKGKSKKYPDTWDVLPTREHFDEIRRVSKHQIIFGGNYFTELLPPSRCWLVWDKKGEAKFNNPFSDCELLWTSYPTVIKKYTFMHQGAITKSKDTIIHPTQKPSELIEMILRDYPCTSLIDPFMGAGSILVAAKRLGIDATGIERSEEYCRKAQERLQDVPNTLFVNTPNVTS